MRHAHRRESLPPRHGEPAPVSSLVAAPPVALRPDAMDPALPLAGRCVLDHRRRQAPRRRDRPPAARRRRQHRRALPPVAPRGGRAGGGVRGRARRLGAGGARRPARRRAPARRWSTRRSARFGRLDVLVNNASTFYPTPVGTITLAAVRRPGRHEPARAAVPVAGRRAGAARSARADHQHGGHPRPAPAQGAPGVLGGQGRARDADQVARARTRPRDARQRHRARARCCGRSATSTRRSRTRSSPGPRSSARARPTTSRARRYFFAAEAPYVTGQVIAVDGGRSL